MSRRAGNGGRWYESHLHRMLGSETYKGAWWYGKTRQVGTEDGTRV